MYFRYADQIMIDAKLLKLLACPVTHQPLTLSKDQCWLLSEKQAYPIRNGIPVLLPDQAIDLKDLPLE